ncbi:hypothetical protein MPTK1_3g21330 [Marchantia polymorpha subsp. ruderalis]|uniref:Nucleolus and neural progenitor protein-like N-terminal domain-containing protein n=2 Tax=Marchantia polymorpha TaxID=3197 RepID=A0AAF6B374_MARPO|nr:hypothetical protein MARPO_0160s0028 [Marchantia polymorpha]BBN06458.1 hypothetical protein Mp_3g21330 [Marchantia polymorpha subsp. ruderalis]|eukprot:PTQ28578.1 hypothetical protein MARPO_0160s0028 [Marchantia polymorpha]
MGHQQLGKNPGFCLHPPASLEKLDAAVDEGERETVLEGLRVEARQVQCRLKEQLVQFRTDVDIFMRLMYRNKNQHRHALYYRRLSQVKRDLRLLDYAELDRTVEGFTRWTFPFKQSRANVYQRASEINNVSPSLCTLLSAVRILNQIDEPILAASTPILGLLSQSYFMNLGLTIFAAIARLRILAVQVRFELATVYNLLSVFSNEEQKLYLKYQSRLVPVEACPRRLPSHLECHWQNGQLSVTEIDPPTELVQAAPVAMPLSIGVLFVDDRKSLAVSKDIAAVPTIAAVPPVVDEQDHRRGGSWNVFDRNRVKYDVRLPAITAKGEDLLSRHLKAVFPKAADAVILSHEGEPGVVSVPGELSDPVYASKNEDRESEVKKEGHTQNTGGVDPDVASVERLDEIPGDGIKDISSQPLEESSIIITSTPGANAEKGPVVSFAASDASINKSVVNDKQSKPPGSMNGTRRSVAYVSVLPEFLREKRKEVSREVESNLSTTVVDLHMTSPTAGENGASIVVTSASVAVKETVTQCADEVGESKTICLQQAMIEQDLKDSKSESGTILIERLDGSNGTGKLMLGSKRPVAEIYRSESLTDMDGNSDQEASGPGTKVDDLKVIDSKNRKKKRRKGKGKGASIGDIEKQVDTKIDSSEKKQDKEEVSNEKISKTKQVGDLFNMLLGDL